MQTEATPLEGAGGAVLGAPPPPPPPVPDARVPLEGIGGWLLIFVVTTGYGSAKLALDMFKVHETITLALDAMSVSLCLISVVLLLRKAALAVAAVYAGLAWKLVMSGYNLWLAWHLEQVHPSLHDAHVKIATQAITGAVMAIVWGLYFRWSERVRNTFPEVSGKAVEHLADPVA